MSALDAVTLLVVCTLGLAVGRRNPSRRQFVRVGLVVDMLVSLRADIASLPALVTGHPAPATHTITTHPPTRARAGSANSTTRPVHSSSSDLYGAPQAFEGQLDARGPLELDVAQGR